MEYCADFETTTNPDDCRVWAWAVCEIGNPNNFHYGNSLDTFMQFMENSDNSTFYFHNLKFDSEFIFVWLFEHGFKHIIKKPPEGANEKLDYENEASKTFTTLISNMGQFYASKIIFEKGTKRSRFAKLYDSLKVLPFKVSEIAKAFNLPMSKLEIDYDANREVGHELSEEEIAYIRNDVTIVAMALDVLHRQGLKRITQGSNAMHDFQQRFGEREFLRKFPLLRPEDDKDIRQCYKGGFTYVNSKYEGKDIKTGLVLDVNSLYPWAMRYCKLPYGRPVYFEGKYEPDRLYDQYIQMFTCQFDLKEGHIPTIQIKGNLRYFVPTEYLETSCDVAVTLCMTNVDLELMMEHYEILNPVWHGGWKFKSTTGLFSEYIDHWVNEKIKASREGNKSMRTLAKLMLNALYGKFATTINVASKNPFYDDGKIGYEVPSEIKIVDGKKKRVPLYEQGKYYYLPVGAFVTAWARHKTITSAQKMYDHFCYADTDSLHLDLDLPQEILDMDEDELEALTTETLRKYGVGIPDDFFR